MMVKISHISAVLINQFKDTLKNTQVLVLFVVYPIIAAVMITSMGEQTDFFISIFAAMHMIFTPLVTTASIMAEEKEKNTLRVLIMAGIRPVEYLLSIGGFVFLCTLLTGSSFLLLGEYSVETGISTMLCMGIGCLCSIVLGLTIGGIAPNMMSANAIAVPVSMVLSFLPMIANFNNTVGKFAKYTYGQQIGYFLQNPEGYKLTAESVVIIAINFLLCAIAFTYVFRRNRID